MITACLRERAEAMLQYVPEDEAKELCAQLGIPVTQRILPYRLTLPPKLRYLYLSQHVALDLIKLVQASRTKAMHFQTPSP